MSRFRDTEDWRSSEADSRRSTDFRSSGFAPASGYRVERARPRRRSSGVAWLIVAVVALLAVAGVLLRELPAWLRR